MPHALPRPWLVLLVVLLVLAAVLIGDTLGADPSRMPGTICPPVC